MEDSLYHRPIQYIKGVGEKIAQFYRKLGVHTLYDLLTDYPYDYEDRGNLKPISAISAGESVCLRAFLLTQPSVRRVRGGLTIAGFVITDGSDHLAVSVFNQKYLVQTLRRGEEYFFFGKIQLKDGKLGLVNPVIEKVGGGAQLTNQIVPQYRLTAGLTQKKRIQSARYALELLQDDWPETLPDKLREQYSLIAAKPAVEQIHFPTSMQAVLAARRRLAFEELFYFQLSLMLFKGQRKQEQGVPFQKRVLTQSFLEKLPFSLTGAQRRVVQEILNDLQKPRPMNRLVQGDVGSGKTVVAAIAMMAAYENGLQSAMMAPTEILARQHYESMRQLFKEVDVRIVLLTGSMTAKEKRSALEEIQTGAADIVLGTQALIQDKVTFARLGLVIADEQHRFGVRQRADFEKKGMSPHMLIMTATPIPRTLSLILYGDLDISVIDELPPGRVPVETFVISEAKRSRMDRFLLEHIRQGRQVYVVCPLVEESEQMDGMKDVVSYTEDLKNGCFREQRVALLHGKMNAQDKARIMDEFSSGNIDILVSTTVIEVGVNVPNASIMVVEDADRFGLSQLHQLRGRVGRGSAQSYCILVSQSKSETSYQRLKIMSESSDGFYIAEQDLKLRGPGEFFGTRQHGAFSFKIANVSSDMPLVAQAQQAARELLEHDPQLGRPEHREVREKIREMYQRVQSQIALN